MMDLALVAIIAVGVATVSVLYYAAQKLSEA